MRKNLFICVTLILIFNLISGCSKRPDEFASIMFFMGEVSCNNAAIEIGASLKQNDIIKTSEFSFCDIKLGGSLVRIKEKSSVLLSTLKQNDGNENVGIELSLGKMLCKSKKLLKSEKFTVKTPVAIAAVRGTSFTVEADDNKTTRIKVFDGSVKVSIRLRQLEEYEEDIIDGSVTVKQGGMFIITEKELRKAEKNIEKFLNANKDKSIGSYAAFVSAIQGYIKIDEKSILEFSADDFQKDNTELIAVEEKPADVAKGISDLLRGKPKTSEGALLVTRYEIYYIKNGEIDWEGKLETAPIKSKGNLYVLSGNNIFCASEEGPVFWRRNIPNAQKIELAGNILRVKTAGGTEELDIKTGESQTIR